MKITIETIGHSEQRYRTCGDWLWLGKEELIIKVSKLSNSGYEVLVAIHELVEAILCKEFMIDQKEVDKWDLEHPESNDPGSIFMCPYRDQHRFAEIVEKLLANEMQINFEEYEMEIESL